MDHEHDDVPTILIIDDDAMTRLLVVETLEPEGFRVEEATGPDEGIDAFLHHRPAVVLLDVEMPGGDGFACCRRLRAMPEGRRVPIVMLTGNDDDASIASAFDAGATDFVSKPMRWKLLGYRIRYLLRAAATVETLATTQISLTHAQALAHVGNWEYQAVGPTAIGRRSYTGFSASTPSARRRRSNGCCKPCPPTSSRC